MRCSRAELPWRNDKPDDAVLALNTFGSPQAGQSQGWAHSPGRLPWTRCTPTEEQARAVEGFVAYAGRYSFHGDRVIHHVELSLFPNWVGSDQERWVELAGDRLTLSASPLLLAGRQQIPRLVWERVDGLSTYD